MSRRLRRLAVAAPCAALLLGLAACGDQAGISATADRLDAVTISGQQGEVPTLEWKSQMTAGALETSVVEEGDGAAYKDGDTVYFNYLLGNGYSESTASNTFGPGAPALSFVMGADAAEPTDINSLIIATLSENLPEGTTRGTRLAFTASAEDLLQGGVFGEQALSLQIGNKDSLLLVVDLMTPDPLAGPEGRAVAAPSWAPAVEQTDGHPSALDFTGTPAPTKQLTKALLRQGTGARVQKGDLLVVNYLGQVYNGETPFDESFTKDPLSTPIGMGAVVAGWDKALVGTRVGSRMIVQIPPADGYGDQEQPANGDSPGIPAGSTLYFVIDILASY